MAVTIKDVALRARVSIASVSRALHGTALSPKRHACAWNAPHGNCVIRHTVCAQPDHETHNTIGVLLPDIYGEYFQS